MVCPKLGYFEPNYYKRMMVSNECIELIKSTVGEQHVHTQNIENYGRDYTEDLFFAPQIVVKPGSAAEVAAVLRLCNEHKISVYTRGAGTGLSGGSLPVSSGIVLAMERLNKILKIDEQNFQGTVEPGVINEVFRQAVESKGLYSELF